MDPVPKTERYRIEGLLGRGAMGTVYRAREAATGRAVALKVLPTIDANAIYRLKHEFRSLASVDHPNLAALEELVVGPDHCFLTMELVEGLPFVDYLRGSRDPLASLPAALEQLVRGVQALHEAGKLHRDLKPSNVLVEPGGRVVILDFGLVSSLVTELSLQSQRGALAGTLAYMAPEQAWGEPLSAAADLYSIGVMVYEALTGTLPFSGTSLRLLLERREADLVPPSKLAPEIPEALDALVGRLLRPVPAERPSADDVLLALAALGPVPAVSPRAATGLQEAPFVGRGTELAALRDAFDESLRGGLFAICVEGPSGIGKTALVERFLASRASGEALVLCARCHPHEQVPFKAVDGLIDDLARYLEHEVGERAAAVLPRNVAALIRVFPVLARAPAVAAATGQGTPGADPAETRRRAFGSLFELLARISDRIPLILWIDDLQWGDRDSASLLTAMRDGMNEARALLILSFRSEERASISQLGLELEGERVRTLGLGPLAPTDTQALLQRALARHPGLASERLEELALESRGSPFFAAQLARHVLEHPALPSAAPPRLARVVEARVDELPPGSRRLLEMIAAAGHPLDEQVALRAVDDALDGRSAIRALRSRGLVREAGGQAAGVLLPYHDRIREVVVERLSPDAITAIHRRLAQALEALPEPDPGLLVHHYLNARDEPRAARLAFEAAERAADGLAFNRAATLYRLAIEVGAPDLDEGSLYERLGHALINAGRGAEGGRCLAKAADSLAAEHPASGRAMGLRRRAAEELLRSGVYAEGLRVLREVLDAFGLWYPPTTRRALAALILSRLGLRWSPGGRRSRPGSADPRQLLDACWSAGHGLSIFDTIRASEFHERHGRLARRLGDAKHVALAVASDSLIAAMEGGARKARRSARLAAEAQGLARRLDDPNLEAYCLVTAAVAAFAQWRFRDVLDLSDRGIALCRDRCVGAAWELANLQACAAMALVNLGEFAELWKRLPEWLREADERSDLYSVLMLRLGHANSAWLAADRPAEARRHIDVALKGPFPRSFTWQLHLGLFAKAQLALYQGDAREAHRLVEREWPALRSSGILRHQYLRALNVELRARCAIGAAADASDGERGRLLKRARKHARQLAAEDTAGTDPVALALLAGADAVEGRREEAVRLLRQAAASFESLAMGAHAAAARYQLASLVRASGARQEEIQAVDWLGAHGVRDPARLAAMLVPGTPRGDSRSVAIGGRAT